MRQPERPEEDAEHQILQRRGLRGARNLQRFPIIVCIGKKLGHREHYERKARKASGPYP